MNRRLEVCLLVSVLLIGAFMGCVSEDDIQFPGAPIISVENISYLGNGYLEYTLVAKELLPYDVRVDLLITTNDEKFTSSPMMKGGTIALRSSRYLRENGGLITLEIQPWEDSGDGAYNVESPSRLTVVAEPYSASDLESSTTRVNEDSSFQLAPDFTLPNTELEEVRFSDYQGKIIIVDFWATWCKPCKEEIPRFIELYDEYQGQGFEMIGISADDVEVRLKAIEDFFQDLSKEGFDINYPILLAEPDTIQSYQVPVLPSAYLINRNGEIVKVFNGAQESKAIYESELKKWL